MLFRTGGSILEWGCRNRMELVRPWLLNMQVLKAAPTGGDYLGPRAKGPDRRPNVTMAKVLDSEGPRAWCRINGHEEA